MNKEEESFLTSPNVRKVFCVSGGRTGTKFLADQIPQIIHGVYGIHEPDKVSHEFSLLELCSRVGTRGLMSLTILKAMGLTGTRNHSLNRLKGKISSEDVLQGLVSERRWIKGDFSIYLEANYQLFGLVEDLCRLDNTYIVLFVRNPEDWLRSWMNKLWYGRWDLLTVVNMFGLKRLTPENIGLVCNSWNNYSRIQKLSWVWNYLTERFCSLEKGQSDKIHLFRFEDLFVNKTLSEISRFLNIVHGEIPSQYEVEHFLDILAHKVNASKTVKSDCRSGVNSSIDIQYINHDLMNTLGYR